MCFQFIIQWAIQSRLNFLNMATFDVYRLSLLGQKITVVALVIFWLYERKPAFSIKC